MPAPVRVLTSYRRPSATTNPYIIQLHRELAGCPELLVAPFSLREALFGSYDVFHLHWPEVLWSARSRVRRAAKQLLLLLFLLRLQFGSTAVVSTVHNLRPHEVPDRLGSFLVERLKRRVDLRIRLNAHRHEEVPEPSVEILHGDYRDWFAEFPRSAVVPGRIVFFGLVRAYKGVEALIPAFLAAATPGLTLLIAGRPAEASLPQALAELAGMRPEIELRLRFLADEELVSVVSSAELVVLPYRDMFNSGSQLAALSLARPVLVPDSAVNRLVRDEVGPEWVTLFGNLSGAEIDQAITRARNLAQGSAPDLSARTWEGVASAHLAAYLQAIAYRGRCPRKRRSD